MFKAKIQEWSDANDLFCRAKLIEYIVIKSDDEIITD